MFWVEECLVQELRIVPGWLMPRVRELLRTADPDLARSLDRERRPEAVLDFLFNAQQHFMEACRLSRAPARIIPLFHGRRRARESAGKE